jgi:hypothetical protein
MKPTACRVLVLMAVALLVSAGGVRATRGASTLRDREKALRLVHQLEVDPFGEKARDARRWLALWMVGVTDFKVRFCPEVLGGTLPARQRIRNEIVAQTTYSSLAFVLANPAQADSLFEVHRAGVLGALRAYEVILAREPGTRSPLLDELVVKRNAGELDAYLAETVKSCSPIQATRSTRSMR